MSNDEMLALKAEADKLGISYHPNIKQETLEERIALFKQEQADLAAVNVATGATVSNEASNTRTAEKAAKEATKLVRCVIAPMNPQERDLAYKIFDCGNKYTGKVCKTIPFNKTWHVPKIILDYIQELTFDTARMVKGDTGKEVMRVATTPAYSVQILPDLTDKELKAIAAAQGTLSEGE